MITSGNYATASTTTLLTAASNIAINLMSFTNIGSGTSVTCTILVNDIVLTKKTLAQYDTLIFNAEKLILESGNTVKLTLSGAVSVDYVVSSLEL